MPDPDMVLVRRDDLRLAVEAAQRYDVRLPQEQGGGGLARLLAAVNGEAAIVETERTPLTTSSRNRCASNIARSLWVRGHPKETP